MRCPSAYCATSSGIAMLSGRVSTHPTFPSEVRTRFQSSIGTSTGTGGGAAAANGAGSGADFGTDSATQLLGGGGPGGRGGGLMRAGAELALAFLRGGGG